MPSVPTSPGRGQPSNFPTPPKVFNQGLDAGVHPAGADGVGRNAEFPVLKK